MLFLKLFIIFIKNQFLNFNSFKYILFAFSNRNKTILKKPKTFIIKNKYDLVFNKQKILKTKELNLDLTLFTFLPLTFHYEPLLLDVKSTNSLENFNLKNKFNNKFVLVNNKYGRLNNLLLSFYNISALKFKNNNSFIKNEKKNKFFVQNLINQEKQKFFEYYNSDLLVLKNSFIFYEDAIILNKKDFLLNYVSYKKYGLSAYSSTILNANNTKNTNISTYSFRLEDGGTSVAWTSSIFNSSLKFLLLFYIPYIFYCFVEFTFLYMLILSLISADFVFILKNYLLHSDGEGTSLINLLFYKFLFDNSFIIFCQELFLSYFSGITNYSYLISIYIQIFFFILFFIILVSWVYDNVSTILIDFFYVNLKKKDIPYEEISSFNEDFLNDDTTEELRDVHMATAFSDNTIPHKAIDAFYDIPRGTDYQKFLTPLFTFYLVFVGFWNYFFLFCFFYIFYIFCFDFDSFIYSLKILLFTLFSFSNANFFFYYNIDFDFFSFFPMFFYILPFFIILFVLLFSLRFSGFTHLYESVYVEYRLKAEKSFHIYYNLLKEISLKTLFINFFSTKAVYYIDRTLISNKNNNIFFFCLNMFYLFLKPFRNIFLLLIFLLFSFILINYMTSIFIEVLLNFTLFFKIYYYVFFFLILKFYNILYFCFLFIKSYNFFLFFIIFFYFLLSVFFISYFILIFLKIKHLVYSFILNIIYSLFNNSGKEIGLFIINLIFIYFIFFFFYNINYVGLLLVFACIFVFIVIKNLLILSFFYLNLVKCKLKLFAIKTLNNFFKNKFYILVFFYFCFYFFLFILNFIQIKHFLLAFYLLCLSFQNPYLSPIFLILFSKLFLFFLFFIIFFYFFYFCIYLLFLVSQEFIFFKWLTFYLKKKSIKRITYIQNNFTIRKKLKKKKFIYLFKESTNFLELKDYIFFFSTIYTYHKAFGLFRNEYHLFSKQILKYKKSKFIKFFNNTFGYFLEFFYLNLTKSIFVRFKFSLLKFTRKFNLKFFNFINKSKFIINLEHYYFSFYEGMHLFKQKRNNSFLLKELAFLKKKYGQDSDIFSKIDHKVPLNIFLKNEFILISILIISDEENDNNNFMVDIIVTSTPTV